MKIFTVYTNPKEKDVLESANFVPEGFNWLAIVFPINLFWAISNRCWLFLLIIIGYSFFNFFAEEYLGLSQLLTVMLKLSMLPFLGVWANDFWRASLKRRGFEMVAIVSGKDATEAQRRWLETSTVTL